MKIPHGKEKARRGKIRIERVRFGGKKMSSGRKRSWNVVGEEKIGINIRPEKEAKVSTGKVTNIIKSIKRLFELKKKE